MGKTKLVRITTVPISLNIILRGQLKYMNQFFEVVGVTGFDPKHFVECSKREGIRMHPVQMCRTVSITRDFVSLWKLYVFLRKEKPAIVHTHTPKAGLLGMMAAKLAGIRLRLHTVGGMPLVEAKGLKGAILHIAERLTYACADRVYPNSFGLKEIIVEKGLCPTEKLKVLGNGGSNGINVEYFRRDFLGDPDSARVSVRQQLGLNSDTFVYCFVGRIATDKGIAELIQAFRDVRRSLSRDAKLLLIGPFENTHSILDSSVRDEILEDPDILTPGRFDDVRPYYLVSDAYVFPSYREGFPNSVLEAGAMGLPAIVTNINGCNEIIQDRVNGLVIPPKNVKALTKAMLAVATDDVLRNLMVSNARVVVSSKFRCEVVWNSLLQEYNSLLAASS